MVYENIIIGGGISGLSLAYSLKKQKVNFLLLEKNSEVGGVIHSERINGFQIEKGANTVLVRNYETYQLLNELGLLEKLKLPKPSAKKRYILKNNTLIPLPTGLFSSFFHPILPVHKLIYWAFKDYFAKPIIHDMTVKEFFCQRFGTQFYQDLIFPMVSGIFAGNPEQMSFRYNFPKFFEAAKNYGSILKGLRKNSKLAFPKEARKYFNQMFTFEGGIYTLIQHLESKLTSFIQNNTDVLAIENLNNQWKIYTSRGEFLARQIILSVPAYVASRLLKKIDYELSNLLEQIKYHPILVLHFTFPTTAWQNPLDGFGFLKSEKENTDILGCIFNSRIFSHVAPKGYELLTVMVGGATQSNLVFSDLQQIITKIQNQLSDILKIHPKPELLSFHKWEKAIPEYGLNYNELDEKFNQFYRNFSNIQIVSNFWGGIGVPDCIQKGISYQPQNSYHSI